MHLQAAFSDKPIIRIELDPDKSFREYQTEPIYRRYAISDEKALKEAGAKLAMLESVEKVI